MNWTGGRLRESKRTGKSLSVMQKNHFAKARAKLQNGTKDNSVIRFNLFEREDNNQVFSPPMDSGGKKYSKTHGLQRASEGFEGVATLDRQLDSVRSRGLRPSLDPKTSPQLSQDHDLLPVSKATRSHSRKSHDKSMSSLPRTTNTKHQVHDSHSLAYNGFEQCESKLMTVEDLEAKRQELLKRSDWLGLTATRPLKMKFPSTKHKDRVGRRRRLTKEDLERRQGGLHTGFRQSSAMRCDLITLQTPHPKNSIDRDLVSVRVGSSIHGTQSSQGSGRRHPIHQKVESPYSSDGALFNFIEAADQPRRSEDMLFSSIYPSEDSTPMLLDNESDQIISAFDYPSIQDSPTRSSRQHQFSDGDESPIYEDRLRLLRDNNDSGSIMLSHLISDQAKMRNNDRARLGLSVRSPSPYLPLCSSSMISLNLGKSDHDEAQSVLVEATRRRELDHKDINSKDWKVFLSTPEPSLNSDREEEIIIGNESSYGPLENKATVKGVDKTKSLLTVEGKSVLDGMGIPILASNATDGTPKHTHDIPEFESVNMTATEVNRDENAEWWRFVFGYEEDEDDEDLPDLGNSDKVNGPVTGTNLNWVNGQSSMVAEASDDSMIPPGYNSLPRKKISWPDP